jgi:NAD(P)-dependent dehydrogenase (short-subunit alcohol dehydrogenase family)
MQDLVARVAVVSGAASGIGLAVAEALAVAGMKVMLSDIDEGRLADEEARLAASGATVASMVTDVGDPEQVDALAAAVIDRFGGVHLVCNNAGIVRPGLSWELSLADWESVLRVNLLGVIHGVRSFLPLLLDSGHEGHVVNVASMAAVVPVPGIAAYNVAKHGVLALSETLHAELVGNGSAVGVTVVMPGRVRTRLGQAPGSSGSVGEDVRPLQPGEIDPAEVGTAVVEAVRQNRLHLFTHPERMGEVVARFARITDVQPG